MNRRRFLRTAGILGGIGGLAGMYAWQIEPFRLEFTRVLMPVKNLPAALAGKTVMQISDIHIGNSSNDGYLKDSLTKAKTYNADFITYTGDFVSFSDARQYTQLEGLLPFFPRGRHGTVAIFGNHEYGRNWKQPEVADRIETLLTKEAIPVLRNAQQSFAGLNFIGLDDKWGTNFFPETVMQHWDPSLPNIVLCHNPDAMDLPIWNNYDGWVLSGHTHGGQCKPPFLPPPLLPVNNKRYTSGKFDFADGRKLYINRALGFTWQVRFNVRPEITIFELQQG